MALTGNLRVPSELGIDRYYGTIETRLVDDEPAIRAVDEIFDSAIRSRASDVHVEPWADGGRVRERVDGVLRESRFLQAQLFPLVLSRLKLLAGMDIADRRLPQDGRYTVERGGRSIDARMSSMPTAGGETLALRLLDARAAIPSLEALGMPLDLARRYRRLLHAPTGFIVVCGPTGSGKTTTLYASLAERNIEAQHLCSVEDPIEIRLHGVAQVQVNARAGLTFAAGLRSFLRQDPNVIMIGEMRDAETAGVATSAALCGQLVMTTLHSDDCLVAIERLLELGIGPRGVATAMSAIVSQRLLRQLCASCKMPGRAGLDAAHVGIDAETTVARAVGCEQCDGTGYRGRSAIFEILAMTPPVRHAIESQADPLRLRAAALESGYEPLQARVAQFVLAGETSVEEVVRAIGTGPV